MQFLVDLLNDAIYGVLAILALVGTFFAILIWRRVTGMRFGKEAEQDAFLDQLDSKLRAGRFEEAAALCQQDRRALPQLALLGITKRDIGYNKLRRLLIDKYERDVVAELEYQLSWVATCIKSAPMLGLLGTVMGMMGAFSKLSSAQHVDSTHLAEDISFALITTAVGLFIAIPLILYIASAQIRIRKMQDQLASGLEQVLESLKQVTSGGTTREREKQHAGNL